APVSLCHNYLHLQPRVVPQQQCRETRLTVAPEPGVLRPQLDYFGNPVLFFTIQEPHLRLSVIAESEIDVRPLAPPPLADTPPWETVRTQLRTDRTPETLEAYQFAFDSRYVHHSADLARYAAASFTPGRPLGDAVLDLTQRIHREFQYDQRAT